MPAEPRQFDVIVLGAGAAGLMCAAVAGARGRRVAVLEHNGQPGRKILISGGGRCNFTNLHCGPDNFISENSHFAKSALALYQPQHFLELVERYGIAWHEKTLGQLFCDGSARAILDMLLAECAEGGAEIVLNTRVISVEGGVGDSDGCDGFRVTSSQGEFRAESLVVATGGLSIPKLGASGLGYELARQFGLGVVEPRAGLVPMVLGGGEAGWTGLAGVSAEVVAWAQADTEKHASGAKAPDHSARLNVGVKTPTYQPAPYVGVKTPTYQTVPFKSEPAPFKSKTAFSKSKPVLFREKMLVTHRGLSGPAVLQASLYWRPGEALVVDFAPGCARSHPSRKNKNAARDEHPSIGDGHPSIRDGQPGIEVCILEALLQQGSRRDLAALKQALREVLPQRLANHLADVGGPEGWSNAALEACEWRLHEWEFHPVGTEGFEKAEVTAGGVDTAGLQARTMEARAVPGLFFIGEVVDVTGQLGGFNFQWAWASAVAAGRAV